MSFTNITDPDPDRPAILGGPPVRRSGPPGWPRRNDAIAEILRGMAESGEWGRYHGPHVPELSRRLAEFHAVEHVLLCSSGTAAVELALHGVGVQAGDEVIVAAYDFKSNFQNILQLKATPVLVDLHPQTRQLDVNLVEAALTEKTRAILVSHLHGGCVPMRQLRQITEPRSIAIVEDACQNPGAIIEGRRAGTWGDAGVLSFGGSKLLTAGRGGAVLTPKAEIAERIKRHVMRGNDAYPLSEIQAAIVLPQLDLLDEHNQFRMNSVIRICNEVADLGLLSLQLPSDELAPAYYKLGFQYERDKFGGLARDTFAEAMRAEGIAMDAGFRGNPLIHGSRRFRAVGELPEATRADGDLVVLHHPVLLEEAAAIAQVAEAVRKIQRNSFAIQESRPTC